jgi:hypothetical protein
MLAKVNGGSRRECGVRESRAGSRPESEEECGEGENLGSCAGDPSRHQNSHVLQRPRICRVSLSLLSQPQHSTKLYEKVGD